MGNKSDVARKFEINTRGNDSIPGAGLTLTTGYVDTNADVFGPVTFRAEMPAHANLSAVFTLEEDADGQGAGTTVDGDDLVGGVDLSGVNASHQLTAAVNNKLSAALSYNGSSRYVRGKLVITNAGSGAVTADCSCAGLWRKQVEPAR